MLSIAHHDAESGSDGGAVLRIGDFGFHHF
jgi:hypothetical protein